MPKHRRTSRTIALVLCLSIDVGAPALFAAGEPAQSGAAQAIAAPPAGEAQDPNAAAGAAVSGGEIGPGGADTAAPSPDQASSPAQAPSRALVPSPVQASPQAPRWKEPRKEESDPRKRRFFRTPGGVMLMIVVGALVVGGATQVALNAGDPS